MSSPTKLSFLGAVETVTGSRHLVDDRVLVDCGLFQGPKKLPAGIVFGGGFPREPALESRRAAQRAIFHVQRELEATAVGDHAIVVCDRGTIDGVAYWPGPGDLLDAVGVSLPAELARYHAVIHLRTPLSWEGYNHVNRLRVETAAEAAAIDARIASAWVSHPRRFEVPATTDFLTKAQRALEIVHGELLACRRSVTEVRAVLR